jgi:hypothetical protein
VSSNQAVYTSSMFPLEQGATLGGLLTIVFHMPLHITVP